MSSQNAHLSQGLQAFVLEKEGIRQSFDEIEENTEICRTDSRHALEVSVRQSEAVVQLEVFAQRMATLSQNLQSKVDLFKM